MSETLRIKNTIVGDFDISTVVFDRGYFETAIFSNVGEDIPPHFVNFVKDFDTREMFDSFDVSADAVAGIRTYAFHDAYLIHNRLVAMVESFNNTHKRVVTYVLK